MEEPVLGARLPLHGPVPGLRVRVAVRLREGRPTGGEQCTHTVLAASSVHVGAVLAGHVEGFALHPAARLRGLEPGILQQLVEQLLPRPGVHAGGVRDHAVHVEDHGGVAGAQHVHGFRRRVAVRHAGHGGGERGSGKDVHGAGTPSTGNGWKGWCGCSQPPGTTAARRASTARVLRERFGHTRYRHSSPAYHTGLHPTGTRPDPRNGGGGRAPGPAGSRVTHRTAAGRRTDMLVRTLPTTKKVEHDADPGRLRDQPAALPGGS